MFNIKEAAIVSPNLKKVIAREGLIFLFFVSVLGVCHYQISKLTTQIDNKQRFVDAQNRIFDNNYPQKKEMDDCEAFVSAQKSMDINPPIPEGHPCRDIRLEYSRVWIKEQSRLDYEYGPHQERDMAQRFDVILMFFKWLILIFYLGRFVIWAFKTLRVGL